MNVRTTVLSLAGTLVVSGLVAIPAIAQMPTPPARPAAPPTVVISTPGQRPVIEVPAPFATAATAATVAPVAKPKVIRPVVARAPVAHIKVVSAPAAPRAVRVASADPVRVEPNMCGSVPCSRLVIMGVGF